MTGPPRVLRRRAPAKINWTLEILGRRPDGFHEIDTILQDISLADELTFTANGDARCQIICATPDVPTDERNLVWRAWDRLARERPGRVGGVRVDLVKHVPSGAGLGGGSSDAAATLLALNELFALGLAQAELMRIGGELGSDVPFFIAGGAVRARGRGELITPILSRLPSLPLVILFPGFKSETPWAYKQLAPSDFSATPEHGDSAEIALANGSKHDLLQALHNTFDQALPRAEPRYDEIRQAMRAAGLAGVMLSGSGAACFGVAGSEAEAGRAASTLQVTFPFAQVLAATTTAPEVIP